MKSKDWAQQATANILSVDSVFSKDCMFYLKQDDIHFHNLYLEKTSLEYLFFAAQTVYESLVIEHDAQHAKEIMHSPREQSLTAEVHPPAHRHQRLHPSLASSPTS